jgi:hypothetical protein
MRHFSTSLSALLFLSVVSAASSCSEPPKLDGRVTDVWGNTLVGATVLVDESKARATTDNQGHFELKNVKPGPMHLMAGLKGYVKDVTAVVIPADKKTPIPSVVFNLWKDPPSPGFFGKGYKDLLPIPSAKVVAIGSDLKEVHGIRDVPDAIVPSTQNPPPFLFSSSLRASEISQLDLKLAELVYKETATWSTLTGPQEVSVKLWVFDKDVPFTLRSLLDKNTFIITPNAPLEPGIYAFHSQAVLSGTEPGSLARYPEQMQVVNLFEIK